MSAPHDDRATRTFTRAAAVDRRGFALLAVLWVMVGLAALALVARVAVRDALAAATYRIARIEARWRAEGCAERARATIDAALGRQRPGDAVVGAWASLDEVIAPAISKREFGCDVRLTPAGVALDVNVADAGTLRRLLQALGAGKHAEALTDAILDWRDADDAPRPLGAESTWYREHTRYPPRNGPIANTAELRRVRGVAESVALGTSLDEALTAEPGRIVLGRAPAPVLRALPGMTDETVARILELRLHGEREIDLARLGALISPAARDTMFGHYPELTGNVAAEPEAWILVARATGPDSAAPSARPDAAFELRLVRAGNRAAIVRRRTW